MTGSALCKVSIETSTYPMSCLLFIDLYSINAWARMVWIAIEEVYKEHRWNHTLSAVFFTCDSTSSCFETKRLSCSSFNAYFIANCNVCVTERLILKLRMLQQNIVYVIKVRLSYTITFIPTSTPRSMKRNYPKPVTNRIIKGFTTNWMTSCHTLYKFTI